MGSVAGKNATSKVIAPSAVRHECYYDVIKHEYRMARVLKDAVLLYNLDFIIIIKCDYRPV